MNGSAEVNRAGNAEADPASGLNLAVAFGVVALVLPGLGFLLEELVGGIHSGLGFAGLLVIGLPGLVALVAGGGAAWSAPTRLAARRRRASAKTN